MTVNGIPSSTPLSRCHVSIPNNVCTYSSAVMASRICNDYATTCAWRTYKDTRMDTLEFYSEAVSSGKDMFRR
jgi:hypothetical protein